MTKLHPSIVITRHADNTASLSMAGTEYYTKGRNEIADTLAVDISGYLWTIEVSEKPAKPRPQRIWDESI